MPALKNIKSCIIIFIKTKKVLVCKFTFLFSLISLFNKLVITLRVVYQMITKDMINKVLILKSILKVPKPDKFNIWILCIIWELNSKQFITIV